MRKKIKKIIIFIIITYIFFVFGSCAGPMRALENPVEKKPTSRVFQGNYDKIWNCTLQSISEYPLTIIEKESGIINTDWLGSLATKKVSVWRGIIGGGQVEDEMPIDVQCRLNVLVSKVADSVFSVNIIRYVKARPYIMLPGGSGNWAPDRSGTFEQVPSDTQTEFRILEKINSCRLRP